MADFSETLRTLWGPLVAGATAVAALARAEMRGRANAADIRQEREARSEALKDLDGRWQRQRTEDREGINRMEERIMGAISSIDTKLDRLRDQDR